MKRNLSPQELSTDWQIWPQELAFIDSKREKTKLGFALLLKHFQMEGRFASKIEDFPSCAIKSVANQLSCEISQLDEYDWSGRTIKRHRAEIRDWLGFKEISAAQIEELKHWLIQDVMPQGWRPENINEEVLKVCKQMKVEPPAPEQCARLIASASQAFELGCRILGHF